MKDYKIIYSNDYLNIICYEYVTAISKKEARKIFNQEHKNENIEIIEVEI